MTDIYNKLVRDKIPEMIQKQGDFPKTEVLNKEDYFHALKDKLQEEVTEYLEDCQVEELTDVVEVILALADWAGVSGEELERMRAEKQRKRGGFRDRIFLVEVERDRR